ncbi:uncharacterized protein LOC124921299 [Impatiens glandulifera]|uniref:uncharacterized protein LOC124921299 n=1 Tax=Impatiens glandulifera TaxID=253017 RepID=UPI001FB1109B|nr:uncharacterized protein LOC124921299 [Impatiens glandulifera]
MLSTNLSSSHSSDNLAEIAARVVQELTADSDHDGVFEFTYEGESNYPRNELQNHADDDYQLMNDDDDDDFEFVVAGRDSPISADEIFCNGQIRPIYPVFNRNLYFDGFGFVHGGSDFEKPIPIPPPPHPRVRIPLAKLLREDRDPPSCSSSEADELDGVPAEIYCLWKPKNSTEEEEEEVDEGKCKKSNSVGSSSKRWKFRNLLHRSNSSDGDGKDMLVFVPPRKKGDAGDAAPAVLSPEKAVILRRKAMKDGEKRASYLPYRKDLVGLFANLHPF